MKILRGTRASLIYLMGIQTGHQKILRINKKSIHANGRNKLDVELLKQI